MSIEKYKTWVKEHTLVVGGFVGSLNSFHCENDNQFITFSLLCIMCDNLFVLYTNCIAPQYQRITCCHFQATPFFFKKITWLSKLVKGTLEHDVDNKLKFTLLITPMFILNLNFSLGYEIFYFILKTFVLNIIYFEVFDYKSIPFIVRCAHLVC